MNYCTNYKYNLLHFIIQPPPARYNEIDSLITVLLLGTVTSASNNRIKRRKKTPATIFRTSVWQLLRVTILKPKVVKKTRRK
jgi:hypothetical protein